MPPVVRLVIFNGEPTGGSADMIPPALRFAVCEDDPCGGSPVIILAGLAVLFEEIIDDGGVVIRPGKVVMIGVWTDPTSVACELKVALESF